MPYRKNLSILILGEDDRSTAIHAMLQEEDRCKLARNDLSSHAHNIVLVGESDAVDAAWLASLAEDNPESIRMAYRGLQDDSESWSDLEPHIDDLYDSPGELKARLPFITKRLALRESRRDQFMAIFEHAVDAIIIINRMGHIKRFNRAAQRIFGYSNEDVLNKNVSTLMPDSYARNHDSYIRNYLTTGKRKIIGIGREVQGLRKNGEVFPMELAVSEFESEGQHFFAGIVRDISERRRLENEILRTSERERRRVGQDLHDGLGQMLTGIGLISGNLTRRLMEENHDLADEMSEITELMREADRLSRNIARGLVPVEMAGEGMNAALSQLCENAQRLFSIECTYSSSGETELSDAGAATNLYRIAQECVSNAVKHGRASQVDVQLVRTQDGDLQLTVSDNGVGFPEELSVDRGMGVDIMHHRARVINAQLSITDGEEGGTVITCTLSSHAS